MNLHPPYKIIFLIMFLSSGCQNEKMEKEPFSKGNKEATPTLNDGVVKFIVISSETGNPIPEANIIITKNEPTPKNVHDKPIMIQGKTKYNGELVKIIKQGKYTVETNSEGYHVSTEEIDVVAGESKNIIITLYQNYDKSFVPGTRNFPDQAE